MRLLSGCLAFASCQADPEDPTRSPPKLSWVTEIPQLGARMVEQNIGGKKMTPTLAQGEVVVSNPQLAEAGRS